MSRCFFELRAKSLTQTTLLASDLMQHLHSRQYLGKALVICDNPFSTLRVARKQWLKLARTIQRERASTLNADKILKFTYAITHMQHMVFSAKIPAEQPEAHVYFIDSNAASYPAPLECATVYIASEIAPEKLIELTAHLPETALVVDYANKTAIDGLGMQPKYVLEARVTEAWQQIEKFLQSRNIDIERLAAHQFTEPDLMDDTLDNLLGASSDFLHVASTFQRTFELAQPIRVTKATQQLYNTLTLLAYRVQALTPSTFTHSLRSYHENETFFLHDIAADMVPEGESLLETVGRHKQAGRSRLAMAILSSLERLHLSDNEANESGSNLF